MSAQSSRRVRRTQETTGQSPHVNPWKGDGTAYPGCPLFSVVPVIGQGRMGTNWNTGVTPEHKEELISYEGDSELGEIACRGCGLCFPGDIQKQTQHDPVQAALGEPALAGVLD